MVDTVDNLVLLNQPPYYTVRCTNVSDGSGEADAIKINKSDLTDLGGIEPVAMDIIGLEWDCGGMAVTLEWDHTTDDEIAVLMGQGSWDYVKDGPLRDPRSGGATGDVVAATAGATP